MSREEVFARFGGPARGARCARWSWPQFGLEERAHFAQWMNVDATVACRGQLEHTVWTMTELDSLDMRYGPRESLIMQLETLS